ncbi:hypothetical protein TSUD_309090 [Trifolium subterraneum]|nr:hypothetical protein TSUD_309090 [Trifolium subterraneum]
MRRVVAVVESYEAYILEEAVAHAGGTQAEAVVEFLPVLCSVLPPLTVPTTHNYYSLVPPSYFR